MDTGVLKEQQQAAAAATKQTPDESRRPRPRPFKRTSWSSRPSTTSSPALPAASTTATTKPSDNPLPSPPLAASSEPPPLSQPAPEAVERSKPSAATLSSKQQKGSPAAERAPQVGSPSETKQPAPPSKTQKSDTSEPPKAPLPTPLPTSSPASATAPKAKPAPAPAAEPKAAPAPAPAPKATPTPAPTPEPEPVPTPEKPPQPRRTLSFRLPVRVNSDSSTESPTQNRSRAQSLPEQPEPSTPASPSSHKRSQSSTSRRQSQNLGNYTLSSIGELATPRLPPDQPDPEPKHKQQPESVDNDNSPDSPTSSDSQTSNRSPADQFLLDRGLPIDVPLEKVPSPLIYQSILESQLNSYLANMSSTAQTAKTPDVATAQQYQQSPPNMRMAMPQNSLVQPSLPGLSGTANGPYGNLLRGPVTADGKLKDAVLTVGIKMDLEAEVHLTARVRGDVLVGLY